MSSGRGANNKGKRDARKAYSASNKPSAGAGKSTNKPAEEKKFIKGKPFDNKYKNTAPKAKVAKPESDDIRLNKYIANSGICSRRDADLYIHSGNVKVNGVVVTEMGYKVKPNDVVNFDGALVNPEKKIYVLLNKPKGFSTSEEDSATNAYDLVRNAAPYLLKPIGRMDKTTVGLLLYTNDNEMIQKFTNAAQRSSKLYQVSLDKNLKYEDLEKIQNGVHIKDHKVYAEEVSYVENQPKSEVGIKVKTSNVKVVRAVFESLGYDVIKLDRVMFAGLTKWGVTRGQWRFLNEQEVINLKNG